MVEFTEIGEIRSPFESRKEAPRGKNDVVFEIEIYEDFEEGLEGLESFSHIHVFYWLDKSGREPLSVVTPWDSEPRGVFATRSPDRPNSIGYSVVELLEVEGRFLKVRGLDAIDGTPVLDIKPYNPESDSIPDAGKGWFKKV